MLILNQHVTKNTGFLPIGGKNACLLWIGAKIYLCKHGHARSGTTKRGLSARTFQLLVS